MMGFFLRKFIPDAQHAHDPQVRKRYGILGGAVGMVCNGLLFLLKLFVGISMHSVAVISDAFNNLSDMAASLISVAGSALGGRRPDSGHPYGHGRAEYISALILAFLILLFGFELLKSSALRLLNQQAVVLSPLTGALLGISILIKVFMWQYHRCLGKRIYSPVLLTAAKDSRNDAIATGLILSGTLASKWVTLPLDAILGILVSCLILLGGLGVAREVIDKLMGVKPAEELRFGIEQLLLQDSMILGVHDLMVHDYGPGRLIASVHAEVPKESSLSEVHDVIDRIEKQILKELNVDIVIHMDPR